MLLLARATRSGMDANSPAQWQLHQTAGAHGSKQTATAPAPPVLRRAAASGLVGWSGLAGQACSSLLAKLDSGMLVSMVAPQRTPRHKRISPDWWGAFVTLRAGGQPPRHRRQLHKPAGAFCHTRAVVSSCTPPACVVRPRRAAARPPTPASRAPHCHTAAAMADAQRGTQAVKVIGWLQGAWLAAGTHGCSRQRHTAAPAGRSTLRGCSSAVHRAARRAAGLGQVAAAAAARRGAAACVWLLALAAWPAATAVHGCRPPCWAPAGPAAGAPAAWGSARHGAGGGAPPGLCNLAPPLTTQPPSLLRLCRSAWRRCSRVSSWFGSLREQLAARLQGPGIEPSGQHASHHSRRPGTADPACQLNPQLAAVGH